MRDQTVARLRIRCVRDAQEERVTRVWRRSRLRVLCCAKKKTVISTGSLWAARLARQTQAGAGPLPSIPPWLAPERLHVCAPAAT